MVLNNSNNKCQVLHFSRSMRHGSIHDNSFGFFSGRDCKITTIDSGLVCHKFIKYQKQTNASLLLASRRCYNSFHGQSMSYGPFVWHRNGNFIQHFSTSTRISKSDSNDIDDEVDKEAEELRRYYNEGEEGFGNNSNMNQERSYRNFMTKATLAFLGESTEEGTTTINSLKSSNGSSNGGGMDDYNTDSNSSDATFSYDGENRSESLQQQQSGEDLVRYWSNFIAVTIRNGGTNHRKVQKDCMKCASLARRVWEQCYTNATTSATIRDNENSDLIEQPLWSYMNMVLDNYRLIGGSVRAAREAESFLFYLLKLPERQYQHQQDNNTTIKNDDAVAFDDFLTANAVNICINAWVLCIMDSGHQSGNHTPMNVPDIISRIEGLFHLMTPPVNNSDAIELSSGVSKSIDNTVLSPPLPDIVSYNTLFKAYGVAASAAATSFHPNDAHGYAINSVELLRQMQINLVSDASTFDQGGEQGGGMPIVPDLISYNTVLHCLAMANSSSSRNKNSSYYSDQAEELLKEMILQSNDNMQYWERYGVDLRPRIETYNTVLNVHAKSRTTMGARRAESLLRSLLNTTNDSHVHTRYSNEPTETSSNEAIASKDVGIQPDDISFNTVMDAWIRNREISSREAAEKAEAIFNLFEEQQEQQEHQRLQFNQEQIYVEQQQSTDKGFSTDETNGDVTTSNNKMRSSLPQNEFYHNAKPTTSTYNALLSAHARANNPQRCESLLQRMRNLYIGGNVDVRPNLISFGIVLDAWAKNTGRGSYNEGNRANSGAKGSARRAESVLRDLLSTKDLENVMDSGGNTGAANGILVCYNSVINAWAKSGEPQGPHKAELLLQEMLDSVNSGIRLIENDALDVDNNNNKGKKDNNWNDYEQIQNDNMKETTATIPIPPNATSFATVMDAWARSTHHHTPSRCATRVLHLLDLMEKQQLSSSIKPNIVCYVTVMHTLVHTGYPTPDKAAKNVLSMLQNLERHYDTTKNPDIRPNKICYGVVLDAMAKRINDKNRNQALENSAQECEELLKRMEDRPEMTPNIVHYNTVLNAWSKSSSKVAPERAEQLLQHMKAVGVGVSPDVVSYNCVISAWARSSHLQAAQKAQAVLDWMENQNDDGVQPTVVSYSTVINAWARQQQTANTSKNHKPPTVTNNNNENEYDGDDTYHARRAEEILKKMTQRKIIPNTICYNAVMNAWAKSTHIDKVSKTYELLTQMKEKTSLQPTVEPATYKNRKKQQRNARSSARNSDTWKPDSFSYGTVLSACASLDPNASKEVKVKAMRIATDVLHDLEKAASTTVISTVKPNQIIYGTFFQACGNLMGSGSRECTKLIKVVFDRCCQQGYVDDFVLKVVKEHAPLVHNKICRGRTKCIDLPANWRRNIQNNRTKK